MPDEVLEFLPFLVGGALVTVQISVLAIVLAIVVGLLVALLRLAPFGPVRVLGAAYVNVFRTTPLLVQLLWIYFALPLLLGITMPAFAAAVLSLGLYTAAFLAEIFRGGITSVERVQRDAGMALGMTPALTFRRVVLPQAVTRMTPALTTALVTLVKDSSLASVLAIMELTRRGQQVVQETFDPVATFTLVGAIYLLVNLPLMRGVEWLYQRRLTDSVSGRQRAGRVGAVAR